MNPPLTRVGNNDYPHLQKKKIKATDIVVVIKTIEAGPSTAQMQFNFHYTETAVMAVLIALPGATQAQAGQDAVDLKRIGRTLLTQYDVFLVY